MFFIPLTPIDAMTRYYLGHATVTVIMSDAAGAADDRPPPTGQWSVTFDQQQLNA